MDKCRVIECLSDAQDCISVCVELLKEKSAYVDSPMVTVLKMAMNRIDDTIEAIDEGQTNEQG